MKPPKFLNFEDWLLNYCISCTRLVSTLIEVLTLGLYNPCWDYHWERELYMKQMYEWDYPVYEDEEDD